MVFMANGNSTTLEFEDMQSYKFDDSYDTIDFWYQYYPPPTKEYGMNYYGQQYKAGEETFTRYYTDDGEPRREMENKWEM